MSQSSNGISAEKAHADAQGAIRVAQKAMEENEELREELDQLREQMDQMQRQYERRIKELEDRTDLTRTLNDAAAMTMDERAAVLIQTLANDARSNPDTDRAKLTVREAQAALGGGLDRAQFYYDDGVFQAAEDLIGDTDVLEYIHVGNESSGKTRLVLRLDKGELPTTAAGKELTSNGGG